MFNKRDTDETENARPAGSQAQAATTRNAPPAAAPGGGASRSSGAAVVGPTISIDGTLKGEEDLLVEGDIKGTIELKSNTLTIGSQGTVNAQVYANTILVDGSVNGDLYASERISIRATARIDGNILAPRISLEDGARFRGSIDMDPESEAFRKAFQSDAPKKSAGASGQHGTAQGRNAKSSGKRDTDPRSPASGAGEPSAADKGGKTGTNAA